MCVDKLDEGSKDMNPSMDFPDVLLKRIPIDRKVCVTGDGKSYKLRRGGLLFSPLKSESVRMGHPQTTPGRVPHILVRRTPPETKPLCVRASRVSGLAESVVKKRNNVDHTGTDRVATPSILSVGGSRDLRLLDPGTPVGKLSRHRTRVDT